MDGHVPFGRRSGHLGPALTGREELTVKAGHACVVADWPMPIDRRPGRLAPAAARSRERTEPAAREIVARSRTVRLRDPYDFCSLIGPVGHRSPAAARGGPHSSGTVASLLRQRPATVGSVLGEK